jgi:hypothetical protein
MENSGGGNQNNAPTTNAGTMCSAAKLMGEVMRIDERQPPRWCGVIDYTFRRR